MFHLLISFRRLKTLQVFIPGNAQILHIKNMILHVEIKEKAMEVGIKPWFISLSRFLAAA